MAKLLNIIAFTVSVLASGLLSIYIVGYIIRVIYSPQDYQTILGWEPVLVLGTIMIPASLIVMPALIYSLKGRLANEGKNTIWEKAKMQRLELKIIYSSLFVWFFPMAIISISLFLALLNSYVLYPLLNP